jgi:hypothetical protein
MDKDTRAKRLTLLLLLWIGLSALSPSAVRLLAQARSQQTVFVPVITHDTAGGGSEVTPVAAQRVFGLLGRLASQQGARFSYTLTTPAGGVYGLAGESPAVEAQMSALLRETPAPVVKVWGEVIAGTNPPLIVVSSLLRSETPTATPAGSAVGGASAPVAIVNFDMVNLHSEPRESSAKTGAVVRNQACTIVGRTPAVTWWLLDCADGQAGWIDVRLVTAQGSTTDVPIVTSVIAAGTPAAPPTPTAQSFEGWRMEMFSNPYLSGDAALVAGAPEINFDWGLKSPSPDLPVDGFSLRLERRINFSAGFYQISAEADDGVRVWVDDDLVIDQWHGATNEVFTAGRTLSGAHDVRVEYFEASGLAYLRVQFEAGVAPQWDVNYYGGTTPGVAALVRRQEPVRTRPLEHDWGAGSPVPGKVGDDFWSARWTGRFAFDGGTYIFRLRVDDGVRVWLDGQLLIDRWNDGHKDFQSRFYGIGQGYHTVTVEYYERSGLALMSLWWTRETDPFGRR